MITTSISAVYNKKLKRTEDIPVFSFYKKDTYTPALQRPAMSAFLCPLCELVILGVINLTGSKVPKEFEDKTHPGQIRLAAFFAKEKSEFENEPPKYMTGLLETLSGERGQYFYDPKHFTEFEATAFGRCRYTSCVRLHAGPDVCGMIRKVQKSRNSSRINLGFMTSAIGAFPELKAKLFTNLAKNHFRVVNDTIPNSGFAPLQLFSPDDWYQMDLETIHNEIVKYDLKQKEEGKLAPEKAPAEEYDE